jgi:phenolic acid decarboxylase
MSNQKYYHTLKGKTITWTWTKGAFKGGKYEVSLLTDNTILSKGLEGAEKGQEVRNEEYQIIKISEDVHTISWLERIGWTITVTLNLKDNKAYGFVSNNREWHPLLGIIDTIQ